MPGDRTPDNFEFPYPTGRPPRCELIQLHTRRVDYDGTIVLASVSGVARAARRLRGV